MSKKRKNPLGSANRVTYVIREPWSYHNSSLLRVAIDLEDLSKEVTHNLWRAVEGGEGRVHVLVTVTATTRGDSPSNLGKFDNGDFEAMKQEWLRKYVSGASAVEAGVFSMVARWPRPTPFLIIFLTEASPSSVL
jgi:hypothetical protein